jgi:hypothetical protein
MLQISTIEQFVQNFRDRAQEFGNVELVPVRSWTHKLFWSMQTATMTVAM